MKFSLNKKIVSRIIDGNCYIVDPQKRILHSLNETGTFIFPLLEKGAARKKIIESLCDEFETDEDTAGKDVDEFLRKMEEKKIIKWKKD